jgi:hypothetical protein
LAIQFQSGRPVIGLHVKRVEINIARIGEEGPYLIRDAESAPVEVIRAGQQARPAGIADMEAVLLVLLRPDRLAGEQEAEAGKSRRRRLVVADVDTFDCHLFT